jgi:hypothetical protein
MPHERIAAMRTLTLAATYLRCLLASLATMAFGLNAA